MGGKIILKRIAKISLLTGLAVMAGLFVVKLFDEYQSYRNIYSPYGNDRAMWEHIFKSEDEQSKGEYKMPKEFDINGHLTNEDSIPQGAIIPHHIIVASELNKFYKSLQKSLEIREDSLENPLTFIILAPNHYEAGDDNVQTCLNCIYKTLNGDLTINKIIAEKIIDEKIAVKNDKTFSQEHAIHSHSQFIKKYFPNAQIVPILFKWKTPIDEVQQTANWLYETAKDKNVFFIASVDFSHYLTEEVADFHDISTWATIRNFDFNNIYDLEIDSPSSIYAMMYIMNQEGTQKAVRFAHTNTQDFLEERIPRTTSHQFIMFFDYEDEISRTSSLEKSMTSLVFTNKFSQSLSVFDSWDWRPNEPIEYPELESVRGEEDRFLIGADNIIFDLDLGQCKANMQNDVMLNICKLKKGVDVKEFKKGFDQLYILADDIDPKSAHKFIDQGADIVINKTNKNDENKLENKTEKYKNKFIIYSLTKAAGIIYENGNLSVKAF